MKTVISSIISSKKEKKAASTIAPLLLLVAVVLLLGSSLLFTQDVVLAQTCTSNFLKAFTPSDVANSKASSFICPVGSVNTFDLTLTTNRTCLTLANALDGYLGKPCSATSGCGLSFLTCSTTLGRCTYKKTRMLGESCAVAENCVGSYGTIGAATNCVNGICVSMQVVANMNKPGDKCQASNVDLEKNIMYTCATGFVCYLDDCVQINRGGVGAACNPSTVNFQRQLCNDGLICDNSVCKTLTIMKMGENCTGLEPATTICETGTVCKKKHANSASKSCEKPSVYGEFCEIQGDCAVLPVLIMKCSRNKCTRRFFTFDDGSCEKHDDCYSSYCDPSTLKCRTPLNLPCSTTQVCPTSSNYVCGCGGSTSASPFNGTCLVPCTGYLFDYQACQYNNGLDELGGGLFVSTSIVPVDKNSTILNKTCLKEFTRLLKCYVKASRDAGVFNGMNVLPGLDVTNVADLVQPSSIVEPVVGRNLTSPSPAKSIINSGNVSYGETSYLTFVLMIVGALFTTLMM